jgi:CBS domain containing-hemolysin-like protein
VDQGLDAFGVAWRIAATAFFVALNGFFVAAEFALVKVRTSRIATLSEAGRPSARMARHILRSLDHYLSACQLGITIASLALGALGEPAVTRLLIAAASAANWPVSSDDPLAHGVGFAVAFLAITILHITLGEQAPKLWALQRAEATTLRTSFPLWAFSSAFAPFIGAINWISNAILRVAGLRAGALEEGTDSADELLWLLAASARAGHISPRQREIAENVLRLVDLEARHILVPRVDIDFVSLQRPLDENLLVIETTRHSRYPVCEVGLDSIVGLLHTRDLIADLRDGRPIDFQKLAREPHYVSETQPLSRLILELQDRRQHCAVVLDERGSCAGLVFLEDALEEIVGPIQDEFDTEPPEFVEVAPGAFEVSARMPLPEAASRLGLELEEAAEDTIGGHVVALLRRLPRPKDEVRLGPYRVIVERVRRRMVDRLRIERVKGEPTRE